MTPASLTLRAASSAVQKKDAHTPEDVPFGIQPGDEKIYVAENNPVLKKLIYCSAQWLKLPSGFDESNISVPGDWKFSVKDAKNVERLVVPQKIVPYDPRYGYGVPLGDTSDLKYFTHLKSVDFSRYKIDKPDEFMKNLPDSLEELSLAPEQDKDSHIGSTLMSNVAHLKNLKKLKLVSMSLTNLDGIQSLTNLEDLDLSKNKLTDISLLAKLTHLKTLNLDENKITDISALAKLTSLSDLDLSSNKVSSVDALKDLSALKRLILDDNHITDVSCLAPFCKPDGLITISASGNSIADVSAISRAVTANFTDENPEYHYSFNSQKLDFDIDPAKSELSAWGIKAAEHTIQYSLGDTHPTRVDANPYMGEENITFKALNLPSGEFKPSWWHLLGIRPHTWSFSFDGTLKLYRYRPYLNTEDPLILKYGSDYPGDDAFVNRVSIKDADKFPKDGRIYKHVGLYDHAINTFIPGLTEKWVHISYQRKDPNSNEFKNAQSDISLQVPVYVKTMAETWNPSIAPLTLKAGERLTLDALKNAITDKCRYNKYVPTREELDNGTYRQEDDNIKLYSKLTQDGDFEEYVCAAPEFDWGSFKDREVSTSEAGTTISVPFTMTFADQSTYSGKVEVKVEAHSSGSGSGTGTGGDTGSGSGTGTGGDTGSGTGTGGDFSGNDHAGSENGTTSDTSNSSSPDNAGDNGGNTPGGTNNGNNDGTNNGTNTPGDNNDGTDNEGSNAGSNEGDTASNEGDTASNDTSSSAETSGAALVHAPAHRFARYAHGAGSAGARGASAQISGGTSAGVPGGTSAGAPGGTSGSLDSAERDANATNASQDAAAAQNAANALNGSSSAHGTSTNASKADASKDTQASHKNGAESALQALSHGWPYIVVGIVVVAAAIVLVGRRRSKLLRDKQRSSKK